MKIVHALARTKTTYLFEPKRNFIVVFMALRTRAKKTVQADIREIGTTGVFIAHTQADQENSMNLLQQNGFRALTYQEAFVKLDQNPELKEQLKGRWLYLDGKGSELSGFYISDEKGELAENRGTVHSKKRKRRFRENCFCSERFRALVASRANRRLCPLRWVPFWHLCDVRALRRCWSGSWG